MKWVLTVAAAVGFVVVLGLIWGGKLAWMLNHMDFQMPPNAVTSLVVQEEKWPETLSAIGTTKAVNGVTLAADLPGVVSGIFFESGAAVKKGDLLVQQDVTQEQAQLRAMDAKQQWAGNNLARVKGLLDKRVSSASDYDQANVQYLEAQANADEIRASIARKTIRAPFDGIAGIREVNIGQYLKAADPIVPVQSLDPIYVNFSLPQQYIASMTPGRTVRARTSGVDQAFEGKINAVNSIVDEATRNLQGQATIANPKGLLRPGMFVGMDVILPEEKTVIAVPSTSISYAPYGDSVYVIEQVTVPVMDKKGKPTDKTQTFLGARQQFVKLGETRGDRVAVVSGLKNGDTIATSGVFKLRPNAPVEVNNETLPSNELKPKPEDS